ncbi:hypothetical protein [Type-D symbiont of Plautia stali]|uniref:hypothetical protein n=1 Tax=Type-D symbiont of Plautia stali TaxID=1560356 RepID=UPI00073F2C58|nr:hypothetical protein [Type-D symbiont of Plautia stali]
MNRSFLGRAGLLLALACPLAMTSCSYHKMNAPPPASGATTCQGCTVFNLSVWHVRADQRDLMKLLKVSRHISPESLNSDSTEIVSSASAEGIAERLFKDRRSQNIVRYAGSTTEGEPLPVALSNTYDSYSATLTAGPEIRRLASRVVKFSLSARLPSADSGITGDEVHESGRVMLKDGDTVVTVHSVRDGWLVWLIGARFSA